GWSSSIATLPCSFRPPSAPPLCLGRISLHRSPPSAASSQQSPASDQGALAGRHHQAKGLSSPLPTGAARGTNRQGVFPIGGK
uniref:Uncharacterized protein n=1 Tax=Aegilops tauschii subsp. strangulata TaxID=200361 RepID=A0A453RNT3_AEGTS